MLLGFGAWLGPGMIFGPIPEEYESQNLSDKDLAKLPPLEKFKYELAGVRSKTWKTEVADRPLRTRIEWMLAQNWEGFGKEFMPPLDEGSYLYMPTTMPHASIGESLDVIQLQDRRINAIPEVELAVGKLGRVNSPLDPAPISMIETIINYKSEYVVNKAGHRIKYRFDPGAVDFFRDASGRLLPAGDDKPYKVQGQFARDERRRVDRRPGRRAVPPMAGRARPGPQSGTQAPGRAFKRRTTSGTRSSMPPKSPAPLPHPSCNRSRPGS